MHEQFFIDDRGIPYEGRLRQQYSCRWHNAEKYGRIGSLGLLSLQLSRRTPEREAKEL